MAAAAREEPGRGGRECCDICLTMARKTGGVNRGKPDIGHRKTSIERHPFTLSVVRLMIFGIRFYQP